MTSLFIYANKYDGLPIPSNDTVVNQLVLNYVLVVFATFLEPFWLLLNRQLCVLQPFEELRKANARASKSLKLTYTSLPSQMNIWKAFRARHYVLGAVCAVGLSANLLAISLNDLLQIETFLMAEGTSLRRIHEAKFMQYQSVPGGSDHFYVAKANFSDGVALPPWTTSDTFLVPFGIKTESNHGSVSGIRASTQGFSIRSKCETAKLNDTALVMGEPYAINIQQRTLSGESVSCGGIIKPSGGQNNTSAALEVLAQLKPIDPGCTDPACMVESFETFGNATAEGNLTCRSTLLAGFLRTNLTVDVNDTKTDNSNQGLTPEVLKINSLSSLFVVCKSTIISTPYEVTVDPTGRIQSYKTTSPEVTNPTDKFTNGTSPISLISGAVFALNQGSARRPYWHNDTFVDTWFAYLIKTLSNSTMFVDPGQPVPAFEYLAPYVEDLFVRLFAIILAQNQHWLVRAEPDSEIRGTLFASSRRVFVSRPMFIITVTLLTCNMFVAVLYWTRRPKRMLPSMPYTIGSILAMVHASGLRLEARKQEEWKKDWRFGYGRFVGTDGKPHVGIERRPFVQPLDP
ncbi:MAG: hypothetical protein Q9169_002010 [Polycauliona sp. 2 TL-2023]